MVTFKPKNLVYCILFLLLIGLVSAAPVLPFDVSQTTTTGQFLQIVHPKLIYHPSNTLFNLSFDVLNSNATKMTSSTTNCTFADNNNVGKIFNQGTLKYSATNKFWYFTLQTNEEGEYAYYLYCNSTNKQKGFISEGYIVTSDGHSTTTDSIGIMITILFLILIYGWIGKSFNMDILETDNKIKFAMINGVKSLMYLTTVWLLLIPTNIILLMSPDNIHSFIELFYQVQIYFNYFFSFAMVIWFLIHMIGKMEDSVK